MEREQLVDAGYDVREWKHEESPEWERATWGKGPWDNEPDRVEWRKPGSDLPRLAIRGPHGSWCGYVGLPPGHPLHGQTGWGTGGEDERVGNLDVHGGVTYARECAGRVCHVPGPGEPEHVWWLGFDCSHAYDYAPGLAAIVRKVSGDDGLLHGDRYHTLEAVIGETESLASQLDPVAIEITV